MEDEPLASHASSHFSLDPVPGSVLLEQEVVRRDGLNQRGNITTGCRELDDGALLGGFERGCVVGLSAEDEEIGLLIGLQTIALLLASEDLEDESRGPRAVIITTLSASVLLPTLRNVIKSQLQDDVHLKDPELGRRRVRAILERVLISRVFDFEGLWEALGELEPATPDEVTATSDIGRETDTDHPHKDSPHPNTGTPRPPETERKTEIQDSEDEGSLSTPPPSAPESPESPNPLAVPPQQGGVLPGITTTTNVASRSTRPPMPDIVLITHISSLLTSLFSRREKAAAHGMLQLMSSHLRFLTRSPHAYGAPLVMILNSTLSPGPDGNASRDNKRHTTEYNVDDRPRRHRHHHHTSSDPKPLDPTLRSIFSPVPPPHGGSSSKPSFGLVFTQLLDIHLLCLRLPRTRADAESVFAPRRTPAVLAEPRFAWVVEVLLDEIGVWEGLATGRPRLSREQRWGAVDVVDGVKVVDAFGEVDKKAG